MYIQPTFVQSFDEIEWVHFERVLHSRGTNTVDLALLYKDHSRKPVQIGQIATQTLESIKQFIE